jgi:hypothetical protein
MKQISIAFEKAFRQNPAVVDIDGGAAWTEATLKLREAISNTAIAIERFFGLYEHICACANKEHETFLATIRPDKRAEVDAVTRPTVHYSRLSDGLVLFLRVKSDDGRPSMAPLLDLVNRCATLILEQLADGHPLRGGIDVGVGADVTRRTGDVDIYGPAFISAYELESKTAEYSRIAVGQGLPRLLNEVLAHKGSDTASEIEKKAASLIAERLYSSPDDGVVMLDFLGKPFAKNPLGIDRQDVRRAHDFVTDQVRRWAGDTSDEGRKLHGRYLRLADYFERRMYLW